MKVGLVTLYRGYNYGTSLQAYALKCFVSSLGYQSEIIWLSEGVNKGRDVRFAKIVKMLWRCLWHPQLLKHTFLSYKNSFSKPISLEIKAKFLKFTREKLQIKGFPEKHLKAFSADQATLAVICGSDQIWSAVTANVDPLYFLRFVPEQKRVAYAPSFGSTVVPQYNKKILAKYIKEIPFVSVREEGGIRIVKELTGRDVPVLIDPTLLLDWEDFGAASVCGDYIVAYFLDTPNSAALESIKCISCKYNCQIIAFPYKYTDYQQFNNIMYYPAGPIDFIRLIKGARCVLTDSFHGTVFSINLQVPFWTFERNYASGKGQNDRIISILKKTGLSSHYVTSVCTRELDIPADEAVLKNAKQWIKMQREVSRDYLQTALHYIGAHKYA